jgi:hypothetical protein
MPDAPTPHATATPAVLPYLVGTSADGNYAFFPSGAVRRLGNTELQRLRDELGVRVLGLSGTDQANAEKVSRQVFGI